MSYLRLTKKGKTGKVLRETIFEDGSFVRLIKLASPYADGKQYSVYETTNNPFCSNGLFCAKSLAVIKYNLIVENNS